MKIDFKGSSWSETAKNKMNLLLLHGFVFDCTERCAMVVLVLMNGFMAAVSYPAISISLYIITLQPPLIGCSFVGF